MVSVNGIEQVSTNQGRFAESINTTLGAGVYYIQVVPGINTPTANYTLNVSAEANLASTDLVWRNSQTGRGNLWSLDSSGNLVNIEISPSVSEASPPWTIEATADFNGDGQADLLWRYDDLGLTDLWLFQDGVRTANISLPSTKSAEWRLVGAADFNDDSQADILWWNTATSQLEVWLMQGVSSVGAIAIPQQQELGWTARGVGNFNRDGNADILWQNNSTAAEEVWFFDGTTFVAEAPLSASLATPWQIAGVADFNDDGNADILWRYYGAGGKNQIWFMNGTTFASSTVLLAVDDSSWAPIPYSAYGEPTPIDVAGNTITTAFNLGTGLGQGMSNRLCQR